MTNPIQQPRKILTPPLIAALAVLVALAVVTVIVVLTSDDDETAAPPGGTTTSPAPASDPPASSAPPPSGSEPGGSEPATKEVVDDDLGVSYSYPIGGYVEAMWGGPGDLDIGVELESAVSYPACTSDAGSDLLYAFVASDDDSVDASAEAVLDQFADVVWGDGADMSTPSDAATKTTANGVTGTLVEADVTRGDTDADDCGTTGSHIGAFAFKNEAGDVVVFVSSHRIDGDTIKSPGDFVTDVAATYDSIALING